jgi:hypothetical protein
MNTLPPVPEPPVFGPDSRQETLGDACRASRQAIDQRDGGSGQSPSVRMSASAFDVWTTPGRTR